MIEVLDLMVDLLQIFTSLVLMYGVLWTKLLDIFIKSMVSLKISILQIWVTWACKITLRYFQLFCIKIKGSHALCDITFSCFIWSSAVNQSVDPQGRSLHAKRFCRSMPADTYI